MKKLLSLILATILVMSAFSVNAAGEISVYIDGKMVSFDVQPQIIGGRTMVPIRAIFEMMGAQVDWDQARAAAICKRGETTVEMTVGSNLVVINGAAVAMDAAPVVINGRTLAPARYAAEAFGASVEWDASKSSVIISSKKLVTLYAPDGRTLSVPANEVETYLNIGWYQVPVITMYAADGRTMVVASSEAEAYSKVGWYYSPVVTLYAPDGRTIVIAASEKAAYMAVGWYESSAQAQAAAQPSVSAGNTSTGNTSSGNYTNSNNTHGSAVYRTPTGKKYHFDPNCGGKNSRQTSLSAAKSAGLTPCSKCAY